MNPNAINSKKRKQLPGVAEDLELPSPKHKCCETVADSECQNTWADAESDITSMLDTQDSSSVHGDAQSGNVDVKMGFAGFRNADSYYEDSTACSSRNRSVSVDSCITGNNTKDSKEEEEKCVEQIDVGWIDIDGLEVCVNGQSMEEGLHEFLSSSGVDPSIVALASERWDGEQETTHPGRPKPTIDQEFEQYFSSLML